MNDRVSQIFLLLGVFSARLKFFLCLFLLLVGELVARLDAVATNLQTLVDFGELTVGVVKAVHTASGGLVIHRVELFVQERVETNLSHFEPLM